MVFSSAVFLFAFLPVTLLLYFIPLFGKDEKKEIGKKNLVLCLVSLVFYAWGEPVHIFLMILSIVFNYLVGMDIENKKQQGKNAKAVFIFCLIFNLFSLGFFKYSGFIVNNINSIFSTEIEYTAPTLPVGISFYTFQILSYVIDVYKGELKAQKNIVPFACYVTMFPQLIAGPIVQYSDIEKQLIRRKTNSYKFFNGILYFIKGLGKKVLFANTIGAVYTEIMGLGDVKELSIVTSWVAVICYTLQIYFDFSGYSDMAVGLGKMFGFEFVQNFNFPYKAKSITDFWRRWHISLSSWFRDYVYIPLGGNRKGTARTILNILIVWSLTGMWHGAAWNFIAWGAFYGILLIAEKYLLKNILDKIPDVLKHIGTLIVVMLGWVFFSSESLSVAVSLIGSMIGVNSNGFTDEHSLYYLSSYGFAIVAMALSSFGFFDSINVIRNKKQKRYVLAVGYGIVFVLCVAYLISETYNPFLYFRF